MPSDYSEEGSQTELLLAKSRTSEKMLRGREKDGERHSFWYLLLQASPAFIPGTIMDLMSVVFLPLECKRFWPSSQAFIVGLLSWLMGAQLFLFPFISAWSDGFKSRFGKRRVWKKEFF